VFISCSVTWSADERANSATLDLAYVAAGAFDIWWEGGCWEWCVFLDFLLQKNKKDANMNT